MNEFLAGLLNMSITGSFIAAVIILMRVPLKKAPRKYSYMLWSILGIRLLCPFSFSSAVSLFNTINVDSSEGMMGYRITGRLTGSLANANAAAPAYSPAAEISGNILPQVLFAVWCAGAAAMFVYSCVSYIRLKRRISGAVMLEKGVYECSDIPTAFVLGIFRPRIYVPTGLSDMDRQFIIAHERTHIRRLDHIIKPIALIALSLHWFNPLVWLSFMLMVRDMEISCDEKAVSLFSEDIRKDYANALLNLSVKQNKLSFGGVLAFGESSIGQRIKNVLSPKKPTLWITIAAIAGLVIAAVCLLTNPSKPQPETSEQQPTQPTVEENSEPENASSVSEVSTPDVSEVTNSEPAQESEESQTDTAEQPPALTEDSAKQTVNAILNSLVLTSDDSGNIKLSFTLPQEIPEDTQTQTKLTISCGADYKMGGGVYQHDRILDWETGLQAGEVFTADLGSLLASDKALMSVMLRAAFMTQTEPDVYRTYYADYVELAEPFTFGEPKENIKNVDITEGGNGEYRLNYTIYDQTFSASITLPDGFALSRADGSAELDIDVVNGGKTVGVLSLWSFGTPDREALAEVDPAGSNIPMQIYSPVALSNMVDYGSSYRVITSTDTGSSAVCLPESRDGIAGQCAMTFDISKANYFLMLSLEPNTVTIEQLDNIASSMQFN